jgi:signal transduction histidine kinase
MRERVRLEAELIQSAKMASLGIMAGGIAHEVRNPLAIVSAAAQLLLERPDDEGLRAEGLQRIQTGVERATSIVENLLKFAGSVAGEMEPVDINDIVSETLLLVEHEITQRRVELRTYLAEDVRRVCANARALEQVLTNLILNACQAIERDGTITVSTGMQGSDVTVSVRDTGPGIGPQDLRRIFDPFFTTRSPGEGTGLGLAISYRIVEQHRGTIDAFNNEEGGAMFVVRLPGVDGARPGATQPAARVFNPPVM